MPSRDVVWNLANIDYVRPLDALCRLKQDYEKYAERLLDG